MHFADRRTDGAIVEAGTAGVVLQHLEKYREEDYRYVAVGATPDQRRRAVRFAMSCVGSRYGNLLLANLVVSSLTRGRVRLESPSELCGSLVAGALASAGESFYGVQRRCCPLTWRCTTACYVAPRPLLPSWTTTNEQEQDPLSCCEPGR